MEDFLILRGGSQMNQSPGSGARRRKAADCRMHRSRRICAPINSKKRLQDPHLKMRKECPEGAALGHYRRLIIPLQESIWRKCGVIDFGDNFAGQHLVIAHNVYGA
jgi:hypothetical protein